MSFLQLNLIMFIYYTFGYISIVIGKSKATVNGAGIAIDSPAFIENGRTYLPVRFVSEALGAEVSWDDKIKAVIIE